MVCRSGLRSTEKSLRLYNKKVSVLRDSSLLAYLVRSLKRTLSSISELEMCFKPLPCEVSSLVVSLFFSSLRAVDYKSLRIFNHVLDNKRYTLIFVNIYSINKLKDYIFLYVKDETERKIYYTTIDEFSNFVRVLEKANEEGTDLEDKEKLKYSTYATLH